MGNVTSFFTDTGKFLDDWQAWLGSAIMSVLCVYTLSNSFTPGSSVIMGMIKAFIGVFLITYIAIGALNMVLCLDHASDIFKDKNHWVEIFYEYQIYILTVLIALAGAIMFNRGWIYNNLWLFLSWIVITIGFYTIYKTQSNFACRDYKE